MYNLPDPYQKVILSPIGPPKIYYWPESAPCVGLDLLNHLDLEKKKQVFGMCLIDQFSEAQDPDATFLFDGYIGLDFLSPSWRAKKLFFPANFLGICDRIKKHTGSNWTWNHQRAVSVSVPMNKLRYARVIVSCWLANHDQQITFLYTQNWENDDQTQLLDELLQIGELKDWTGSWGPSLHMLPKKFLGTNSDYLETFTSLYDRVYAPAASCVIIGAIFWEHGCELCEKYLTAVYAGCIPLVHGYGIYDRLKDLGFDTFDDIIDTSSQYERNPVKAAWNLMDLNRDFLCHAMEIWHDPRIQERLRHNLYVAQDITRLYHRAWHNLNTVESREIYQRYKKEIWSSCNRFTSCFALDFSLYDNQRQEL